MRLPGAESTLVDYLLHNTLSDEWAKVIEE